MDAAGFGKGVEAVSALTEKIGFVEAEEPDFAADQRGSGILGQGGHDRLLVIDALPEQPAIQRDRGAIVVHQVTPDAPSNAVS